MTLANYLIYLLSEVSESVRFPRRGLTRPWLMKPWKISGRVWHELRDAVVFSVERFYSDSLKFQSNFRIFPSSGES